MTGATMAGISPNPRTSRVFASWPRELHRAAAYLAAGGLLYWMAFAFEGWSIWISGFGIIYMDLILAWLAVLLGFMAWPDLWDGLRDLLAAHPKETDALVARRSYFVTLLLVAAAVALLPVSYHVVPTLQAWFVVLYISTFPYLAWVFIPTLALHGILFGRVGNYLAPSAKRLTDVGAMILFAVSAATTLVVLNDPGSAAFVRSWSVGGGVLPAVACVGYVLIATGMTMRSLPESKAVPTRGWALAKTPRGGPERFA
jgi:hypothetical protein